ncbi:ROK family protein [Soehngenia saccharolytica]|nr:ROK family protein [Soehngenia saccharolytica]
MKYVVGVDLGGTKINAGVVDEKGNILKKASAPTSKTGNRLEILDKIETLIKELNTEYNIDGVGIGSPGFIDSDKGEVLTISGNVIGWSGTKIKQELGKRFNYPIQVENDANAAAICEGWLGSAKDYNSFVMITLGTGLGGGIVVNRDLIRGSHFQGSELGHAILYPNGVECSCGQKGCVERYISGTAVEFFYHKKTGKNLSGEEIFSKYYDDVNAKEVIDKFAMDLGYFLVSLKNILDPEAVVIGGGVILSKDIWWSNMINHYHSLVNDDPGIQILPAKYLNDSGIVGAAKAILNKINS